MQLETLERRYPPPRSHDAWEEHNTDQDESEYQLVAASQAGVDPAVRAHLHLVVSAPAPPVVLSAEEARFLVDVFLVPDSEQNLAGGSPAGSA
jgi:hypothetical protein